MWMNYEYDATVIPFSVEYLTPDIGVDQRSADE